ncbi:FMN-binding negative transcriptional regulator [Clavibacter sp. VKM Ac-2873]|uniref:FMN-binding negative transcriptional regulator n=1 Tax=Clavibacter sp. VKM Ac-2873 TaxID=2783813 RepID=UPI00188B2A62|nr:FMN-binding negative transcriptional regulator [Clavibacter sp. VKM Ac-2873]
MRENPSYALEDVAEVRRLVDENPWATIVSGTGAGLVASHYPVLLDPARDDLTLLTHVGRPDERIHELGRREGAAAEVLVIVQGPHGYISPGWYDADPAVPTWNHVSAHLTCRVEILSPEENLRVLGQLVDRFEDRMPEPRRMEGTAADAAYAARIGAGTVGLRLVATRFVAKAKLSQDKPQHVVERVLHELEHGAEYANAALAAEMRHARARAEGGSAGADA